MPSFISFHHCYQVSKPSSGYSKLAKSFLKYVPSMGHHPQQDVTWGQQVSSYARWLQDFLQHNHITTCTDRKLCLSSHGAGLGEPSTEFCIYSHLTINNQVQKPGISLNTQEEKIIYDPCNTSLLLRRRWDTINVKKMPKH